MGDGLKPNWTSFHGKTWRNPWEFAHENSKKVCWNGKILVFFCGESCFKLHCPDLIGSKSHMGSHGNGKITLSYVAPPCVVCHFGIFGRKARRFQPQPSTISYYIITIFGYYIILDYIIYLHILFQPATNFWKPDVHRNICTQSTFLLIWWNCQKSNPASHFFMGGPRSGPFNGAVLPPSAPVPAVLGRCFQRTWMPWEKQRLGWVWRHKTTSDGKWKQNDLIVREINYLIYIILYYIILYYIILFYIILYYIILYYIMSY